MKKVWIQKRTNRASKWVVSWIDGGKQKTKSFPTKSLAENYRSIKHHELNIELVRTAIGLPYASAAQTYLNHYKSLNRSRSLINDIKAMLGRIESYCQPATTTSINQQLVNHYLAQRQADDVSQWSVNKDVRMFKTFLKWLNENNYNNEKIKIKESKATAANRTSSYTDKEIAVIIAACPNEEWRLRIVLALCTGLRRLDLCRLPKSAIDIDNAWMNTIAQKTGKLHSSPIPDKLLSLIKKQIDSLPSDYPFFFKVVNSAWLYRQWRQFRPEPTYTMQLLRKTHATRIESTGISTAMLGHSSSQITRTFYNDMDYIKYIRVNQLPIDKWLNIDK